MYHFFSDEKIFGQDQMVNSQNNSWLALSSQDVLILMKTKHHHGIWGGHYWWWCYASIYLPTWPHNQHGGLHEVPGEGSATLDWEGGCCKTLYLATGLCHATQAGEPSLGFEKISATTSLLTFGCLTPQIAIPLIIIRGAWLSKRPTKLCTNKNELKARITAAFINLNKENIGKASKRFWCCLETKFENNCDFFE